MTPEDVPCIIPIEVMGRYLDAEKGTFDMLCAGEIREGN